MSLGNSKKAISVAVELARKKSKRFRYPREYANLLMGTGDLINARKEYEVLYRDFPEDPITLNNLGWLVQKDSPDRAFSLVSLAEKNLTAIFANRRYPRLDEVSAAGHQGDLPLLQRAHNLDPNSAVISYIWR